MWPFKQKPSHGATSFDDGPGTLGTPRKAIRMSEPRKFDPIHVVNGDAIQFTLTDEFTGRKEYLGSVNMHRSMKVDTAVRLIIEDDLGFNVAVGVLCGESK